MREININRATVIKKHAVTFDQNFDYRTNFIGIDTPGIDNFIKHNELCGNDILKYSDEQYTNKYNCRNVENISNDDNDDNEKPHVLSMKELMALPIGECVWIEKINWNKAHGCDGETQIYRKRFNCIWNDDDCLFFLIPFERVDCDQIEYFVNENYGTAWCCWNKRPRKNLRC